MNTGSYKALFDPYSNRRTTVLSPPASQSQEGEAWRTGRLRGETRDAVITLAIAKQLAAARANKGNPADQISERSILREVMHPGKSKQPEDHGVELVAWAWRCPCLGFTKAFSIIARQGHECFRAAAARRAIREPVPEQTLAAGTQFDHAACSYSVTQAAHAFDLSAMLAAEECAFLFQPVANDMNTTIVAGRSQRMDRALKAIEGMGRAVHGHLKGLIIVISAGFASGHDCLHSVRKCCSKITRAIRRQFLVRSSQINREQRLSHNSGR